MGSSASCDDLSILDHACQIHHCITSVNGIKSNSLSPTDTWVVKFSENTRYDMDILNRAFIKVWVHPYYAAADMSTQLDSLSYEMMVYRDIVRPLRDFDVCNNFVRFLAGSEDCTFDDLVNITKIAHGGNRKDGEQAMLRNLTYMESKDKSGRPSINVKARKKIKKKYHQAAIKKKYSMMVNEAVDAQTICDWFEEHKDHIQTVMWPVLYQVAAACYAMTLARMTHNDLHDENVWITTLDEPTCMSYDIGYVTTVIKTKYWVRIFDFDIAYAERIGDNPKIPDRLNEVYEIRDFAYLCNHLYKDVSDEVGEELINLIAPRSAERGEIKKMFMDNPYMDIIGTHDAFLDFRRWNTIEKVLRLIRKKINTKCPVTFGAKFDHFSVCNPSIFDEEGIVKLSVAVEKRSRCAAAYRRLENIHANK